MSLGACALKVGRAKKRSVEEEEGILATMQAANSEKGTITLKWNTYQKGMEGKEIFKKNKSDS